MSRLCSKNERKSFKTLTGKIPLRKRKRRWEDRFEWILKKWVTMREIGLIRIRTGIIREPL
jgi:hypothetical protein